MERNIDGKLFDTDSIKCCGNSVFSYYGNDDYCFEGLYRKDNGEFFLYCEGGKYSAYSKIVGGDEFVENCKIRLLTFQEAKEWAKENVGINNFVELFGEMPVEEEDN